jgi:uncharacterized protein with HEPN domain
MSRDDTYLLDIFESARIALDYVAGKSWDEFYEDMQCQDAVLRRLEIIGEAARTPSALTLALCACVAYFTIRQAVSETCS